MHLYTKSVEGLARQEGMKATRRWRRQRRSCSAGAVLARYWRDASDRCCVRATRCNRYPALPLITNIYQRRPLMGLKTFVRCVCMWHQLHRLLMMMSLRTFLPGRHYDALFDSDSSYRFGLTNLMIPVFMALRYNTYFGIYLLKIEKFV